VDAQSQQLFFFKPFQKRAGNRSALAECSIWLRAKPGRFEAIGFGVALVLLSNHTMYMPANKYSQNN
jgi:hypothetical protein